MRQMVPTFTAQHAEIADHNLRMNSGDYKYLWQVSDGPNWHFDLAVLAGPMAEVSRAQGLLMGRASIARRLGVDIGALAPVDRHVEGVVEMIPAALCRWCLARADGSPQRFYSLSAQIQRERTAYYDIL